MQKLPSLNVLKVFNVAAKHLSFKLAADELCLSPSAVSHQIKVLETQLGLALFERLNRGLKLTLAGEKYCVAVNEGIQILEQATQALGTQQDENHVTISSIPFISNHFLIPHLTELKKAHPELSIKLLSQIERVELKAGGVDMAVRYQKQDEPNLVYEALADVRLTPICSPEYWQAFQNNNAEFIEHKFINLSVGNNTWHAWLKDFPQTINIEQYEMEMDNYQAVKQAAVQGLGLAMGYWPAVKSLVASGDLISPYDAHTINFGALYLVYPKKDAERASVKAIQSWIRTLFPI